MPSARPVRSIRPVRVARRRAARGRLAIASLALMATAGLVTAACATTTESVDGDAGPVRELGVDEYQDRLHGAWQATMVANQSGLDLQGIWIDDPGPGSSIELEFPEQWSTDDDTHVEWLDLHILETHGIDPTPEQVRDEWVAHLNNDIWVSTRVARDLMDEGVLPPETGSAERNPQGVWSIDAQLQTELFGLVAPGLPSEARRRAARFAAITNSGLAVDVSAFYAHLYAEAFFESDIDWLLDRALAAEPDDSEVAEIVGAVRAWHQEHPDDWRTTRARIAEAYDTEPEWWASRVNTAATIMALLYGDGDLVATLDIAGLAGWDADNNMTAAAGLLGVILGFDGLPPSFQEATDVYFNQDLTGDLPMFDSVANIAVRTRRIGDDVMFSVGTRRDGDLYRIPVVDPLLGLDGSS
ncbi:MAG: ADP-ribosylglycohydrolase family protein [Actinomycetota bacterium]